MGIQGRRDRSGRRVYRVGPEGGQARQRAGDRSANRSESRSAGRSGGRPDPRRSAGLLLGSLLAVGLATVELTRLAASGWRFALAGPGVADPASTDALVAALAASVAAALAGWLLLGVLLTCMEIGIGQTGRAGRAAGRCSRRVAPAVLRHGVAALLGVTLGVGTLAAAVTADAAVAPLSSVATASTTSAGRTSPTAAGSATLGPPSGSTTAELSPGWTPTRPQARHTAPPSSPPPLAGSRATRAQARAELGDEVVVRRGDTLWALAARQLGRDASDAQIALEWPTWFAANRSTIGDDPNLLLPGLRLRVPEQGGGR